MWLVIASLMFEPFAGAVRTALADPFFTPEFEEAMHGAIVQHVLLGAELGRLEHNARLTDELRDAVRRIQAQVRSERTAPAAPGGEMSLLGQSAGGAGTAISE